MLNLGISIESVESGTRAFLNIFRSFNNGSTEMTFRMGSSSYILKFSFFVFSRFRSRRFPVPSIEMVSVLDSPFFDFLALRLVSSSNSPTRPEKSLVYFPKAMVGRLEQLAVYEAGLFLSCVHRQKMGR